MTKMVIETPTDDERRLLGAIAVVLGLGAKQTAEISHHVLDARDAEIARLRAELKDGDDADAERQQTIARLDERAGEPQWICLDCTAECEDRAHAWVRARRVEREDAKGRVSDAWLVDLTDLNENPDV